MNISGMDAVAETVGKVIGKLADKYLPASLSEQEREDFRLKARALALDEYRAAITDVQGARELAGKEGEDSLGWTKVLTVTHRPAWSFAMLGIFGWTVIAPYLGWPVLELSSVHKDVMQTVIIFYFGGRSIEKVTEVIKGK